MGVAVLDKGVDEVQHELLAVLVHQPQVMVEPWKKKKLLMSALVTSHREIELGDHLVIRTRNAILSTC